VAEAHEKAEAARALLRRGIDPRRAGITLASRVRPERPSTEGPSGHSVEHLAHEFMSRHVHRRRRRPEYVQRILNAEVLPRWGSRDARTIKPREVIELLDEIADRAPVMANAWPAFSPRCSASAFIEPLSRRRWYSCSTGPAARRSPGRESSRRRS
jgi:hypothetical protein